MCLRDPLGDDLGVGAFFERGAVCEEFAVALRQCLGRVIVTATGRLVLLCFDGAVSGGQGVDGVVEIVRIEHPREPAVDGSQQRVLTDVGSRRMILGARLAVPISAEVIDVTVPPGGLHAALTADTLQATAKHEGPLGRGTHLGALDFSPHARVEEVLCRLEVLDGHERLVSQFLRPDPFVRRVPAHARLVAHGNVIDVDEHFVSPLAVPDLAAGVARIAQDRPDRRARPDEPRPMTVAPWVVRGRTGDAVLGEVVDDRAVAQAREKHLEDPRHDGASHRVGDKEMLLEAGSSLGRVRMRATIGKLVAVGWASAEEPTLGRSEGRHGGPHADLDAVALGLRQPAEQQHHEVLHVAVGIKAASQLGHPEVDAVVDEQREDQPELVAIEHPVRLADYDRVKASAGVAESVEESRGLRSALPGQRAGLTDIEELANDLAAMRLDEGPSARKLPLSRGLRVLIVLGRAATREPEAGGWLGVRHPCGLSCGS